MLNTFINAINTRVKIRLTFYSKEDGQHLTRLTAPMDYGPSRKAKNQDSRFHFWDYESDKGSHVLSLLPNQIVSMEETHESFNPSEFVTWPPNWFVSRDWGIHS